MTTDRAASRQSKRAVFAGLAGTTVEYYDFFLYGTASALIFGPQFFPNLSPVAALLASFGVFGVGFLARPLGGLVMGHFGDRVGRKKMLVLSLLMVGLGTFSIGLLPTYESWGLAAPIILVLLRLIQGFGVGGEWSGAVLMSVEHAPPGKEASYGVLPQMGVPLGLVLANIAFLAASASTAFEDWVWRIPFLFSGVLILLGLFVRFGVAESPDFRGIEQDDVRRKMPLVDVLREHPYSVVIASALPMAPVMITYIFATFGLTYMTTEVGIDRTRALVIVLVGTTLYALSMPVVGWLCDRSGTTLKIFLFGVIWLAICTALFFPALNTASTNLILLVSAGLAVGLAATYGPIGVLISRLFPANLRFSGSAIGYQTATLLAGAPAPFVATAILANASWVGISLYMVLATAISAAGGVALLVRRSRHRTQDVGHLSGRKAADSVT